MLHVICTQLSPVHKSVCGGDSLRCSEEIVKNLELCLSVIMMIILLLLLLKRVMEQRQVNGLVRQKENKGRK